MMDNDLELRQAIRSAAEHRRQAETDRAQAMSDLADLARRAVKLGIPIATIAEDADLSRPSIYALLKD